LARYHELTRARIRAILAGREPTFTAYRAEQDPDWPKWQSRSWEEILVRLRDERETLIATIDGFRPGDWALVGRHSHFGPLSLRAWLELFLAHEGHHLYVMARRARRLE